MNMQKYNFSANNLFPLADSLYVCIVHPALVDFYFIKSHFHKKNLTELKNTYL